MSKNCDTCKHYVLNPSHEPCSSCEASDWGKEKYTYPGWESASPKPRRKELQAEIERLKAEYNTEVDQYNAGYEAGEKGGLDPFVDQPHYKPDYDSWRSGYCAGSYDRLAEQLAAQDAIIAEQEKEIAQFEVVSAAKENTIAELRRDFDANQESLYFNTKVEIDGLKKQLAAKDAQIAAKQSELLPVGTRVSVEGGIVGWGGGGTPLYMVDLGVTIAFFDPADLTVLP